MVVIPLGSLWRKGLMCNFVLVIDILQEILFIFSGSYGLWGYTSSDWRRKLPCNESQSKYYHISNENMFLLLYAFYKNLSILETEISLNTRRQKCVSQRIIVITVSKYVNWLFTWKNTSGKCLKIYNFYITLSCSAFVLEHAKKKLG